MSEPGAGGQAEADRADTGQEDSAGQAGAGAADEPEARQTGAPVEAAGALPSPPAEGSVEAVAGGSPEAGESPAAIALTDEPPTKGVRGGVVSLRVRLPRTRRGIFALLLVVGAFAFAGIWTSVTLVHWTETADFCGRCHQMGPELAGYQAGAHKDVTCGECHVEPGIAGWVKAKLNGTRQLIQVLTGTYPKPIPPPDHSDLPAVQDTCLKCHSLDRLATSTVYTRTSFAQNEPNSRSFIGLMVRPNGGNPLDVTRSVHWHVLQDVQYRSPTENTATIDLVEVKRANGTVDQYIAQPKIKVTDDVQPEIDAIKASETDRRMDCLQCHNRVGHPIPNPRTGLDTDLTAGLIDNTLPYVKREGMRILSASYPNAVAADTEAEKLAGFYALNYPAVAQNDAASINQAINQIKILYRLTAMPDMKVTYGSYPSFMGHQDFPGCFRCHDGGHFKVVNGAVTKDVIPYTCNTCHTFPQLGSEVATLPLGQPPATHAQSLWVFNHKGVATSTDPGGQSCGQCHARDYCEGCHQTGAINVSHEEMATNHAQAIRDHGNQSCAYCHQPVYCARCHSEPVLPPSSPYVSGTGSPSNAPAGIKWPLVVTGPSVAGRAPGAVVPGGAVP